MNLADVQKQKEAEAVKLQGSKDNALRAFTIALRALADAASAGNVTCKQALREIWPLLPDVQAEVTRAS